VNRTTELSITGSLQYPAPSGSSLDYTPYTGAYAKNGITCDDQWTSCTISNSTVQGEGPQNGVGQNGIQFFGNNKGTLSGDHVSDNTYTAASQSDITAEYFSCGVLAINTGTLTMTGNDVFSNDTDIYASWDPAANTPPPTPPDFLPVQGIWTVTGNEATGATADGLAQGAYGWGVGLWLDGTTTSGASTAVDVYGNTLEGNAEVGLMMTGDDGETIGSSTSGDANVVESNPTGVSVQGPSSNCESEPSCTAGTQGDPSSASPGWGSTDNTFSANTVSDNGIGVVLFGADAPTIGSYNIQADVNGSYGNDFKGNTWKGNSLANVLDLSGYGNGAGDEIANQFGTSDPSSDPTNSPKDSCEPSPGDSYSANSQLATYQSGSSTLVAMSTVNDGGTEAFTDNSSGFSAFTSGSSSYLTDSLGLVPAAATVQSIGSDGDSLTMSKAATGSSGTDKDILSQGDFWAC
jgi:parallel beta-helix repeat protein